MFRWASPPPPVVSPWLLLGSSSLRGFVRLFLQCCSPLWRTHENLRTVRVDGLKFEYQLTEDDVRKVCHPPCQAYDSCKGFELASQSWFWEVFSRYGDVVLVKMDREGTTSQATCEAARSRLYIYIYLSIYIYIHTHVSMQFCCYLFSCIRFNLRSPTKRWQLNMIWIKSSLQARPR